MAEAGDAGVGVALRPQQGNVDVGMGKESDKGADGEDDGDDEERFEGRKLNGRRKPPGRGEAV